jgi:hypothetical protein
MCRMVVTRDGDAGEALFNEKVRAKDLTTGTHGACAWVPVASWDETSTGPFLDLVAGGPSLTPSQRERTS